MPALAKGALIGRVPVTGIVVTLQRQGQRLQTGQHPGPPVLRTGQTPRKPFPGTAEGTSTPAPVESVVPYFVPRPIVVLPEIAMRGSLSCIP